VLRFVLNRLLQALPVLLAVFTLTFFMVRAAPGGPFSADRRVSKEVQARLDAYYGFDKPLAAQYFIALGHAMVGDLGPSYKHEGRTVNAMIGEAFPVSLELGLYGIAVALALGVPVGVVAAWRRNTWLDYGPMGASMAGMCLPSFVLGPILAEVFGLWFGWVNPTGWFSFSDRLLPAITIGLPNAANVARLTRAGMGEILSQDFIRTARAKGLSEGAVLVRHGLRGGLLPVTAYLGPAFASIITGSFVVESIFSIPGLGRLFVSGALGRDYTMVQGTVLLYAALVVLMNLAADIAQAWLNPKLRDG